MRFLTTVVAALAVTQGTFGVPLAQPKLVSCLIPCPASLFYILAFVSCCPLRFLVVEVRGKSAAPFILGEDRLAKSEKSEVLEA